MKAPPRRLRVSTALVVAASFFVLSCIPPNLSQTLHVQNGTTMPVSLLVNGRGVEVIPAGGGPIEFGVTDLGPAPWRIRLVSPSGRLLLETEFTADAVSTTVGPDGEVILRGAAARVDLSCGRLDIWSGPPLAGPAPGAGTPGDCDL